MIRIAASAAAITLAGALSAQEAVSSGTASPGDGSPGNGGQPALHEFRTPAGDRVILVRTPAQPLVHWAMWTPAGPGEDPFYWPGLSVAVAEAGLSGTSAIGTLDPAAERQALQAIDRWILAERAGEPVELAALKGHFTAARQASDWFAWPRVLAGIPTSVPEVLTLPRIAMPGPRGSATSRSGGVPTGTVLRFSLPPDGLAEAAQRLAERREDPALRAVWSIYSRAQQLARQRNAAEPFAQLRAELLHLAFPGEPRGNAFDPIPERKPLPTRLEAAAVWRLTQHPRRTVHVLVGDLEPAVAEAGLGAAFKNPSGVPLPPRVRPPAAVAQRSAQIQSQGYPAVAIGFRRTGDEDMALLKVACRWLAEGWEDPLARALAKPGRRVVATQAVPDLGGTAAQPGMFVLEVLAVPAQKGAVTAADLQRDLEESLRNLLGAATPEEDFRLGVASWRRELAARLADPAGLAVEIATEAAHGRDPAAVDRRGREVTWAEVQGELRKLMGRGDRVVVTAEVAR